MYTALFMGLTVWTVVHWSALNGTVIVLTWQIPEKVSEFIAEVGTIAANFIVPLMCCSVYQGIMHWKLYPRIGTDHLDAFRSLIFSSLLQDFSSLGALPCQTDLIHGCQWGNVLSSAPLSHLRSYCAGWVAITVQIHPQLFSSFQLLRSAPNATLR